MCSGCASDDPRPESFAQFDVSSPSLKPMFAGGQAQRRRQYRTRRWMAMLAKPASLLGFMHVAKKPRREVCSTSATAAEAVTVFEQAADLSAGVPVEIRVSADTIIELYGEARGSVVARKSVFSRTGEYAEEWSESSVAREDARKVIAEFRRARRTRHIAAYGLFAAIAVLVAWCAMH